MKKFIIYLSIIGSIYSQTVGTTSDGKTVLINDDGTWEIVNDNYNKNIENENKYMDKYYKYNSSIIKENLSHISISIGEIAIPLYSYFENIEKFHWSGERPHNLEFRIANLDSDSDNELIISGTYRTAGYSSFYHVFDTLGDKLKIYKNTLNLDGVGGGFYDFEENLFLAQHDKIKFIICRACGYQFSSPKRKNESSRDFKKRIKRDPMAKFSSIYPDYEIAPYVRLKYENGELYHPKQNFLKNTEYFEVINFINEEIMWENLNEVTLDDGSKEYIFLYENNKSEKFDNVIARWYRPLVKNIMSYHYNSMKPGSFPSEELNVINTKRIFYETYKAYDVDERWKELLELIDIYNYKKL